MMPITDVKITSNAQAVKEALAEDIERALEAVGLQAMGNAQDIITAEGRVDTGQLRNSIAYHVDMGEKAVYIGSNLEHAIYNEVGTGIYAEGGGGRKTPWRYVDANGEGHWTVGMKPIHFLKRAVSDYQSEYEGIIDAELRK